MRDDDASHPGALSPAIGLQLEQQLCFALHAANADIQEAYRESLLRLRLSYPQYLTMLVLWEGNPVTTQGVAQRLRCSTRTASLHLRRLEQRGFAVRRPGGGRDVPSELTDKGSELLEHASTMQSCLETSIALTPEEIETLRRLALKVLDSSWQIDVGPLS